MLVVLLLAPLPAEACSTVAPSVDLGLPGALAGPEAVFTPEAGGILDADGAEVEVLRHGYELDDRDGTLLVPVEPLAPGEYFPQWCAEFDCVVTIAEGEGDPGVPPDPPELSLLERRMGTGANADCGPFPPATQITAVSDALTVVFARAPVDTLDGADLFGLDRFAEAGEFRLTTHHEGEIFAAALDAEGELSEWVPVTLDPGGCSTAGAPAWLGAIAAAGLLSVRRR